MRLLLVKLLLCLILPQFIALKNVFSQLRPLLMLLVETFLWLTLLKLLLADVNELLWLLITLDAFKQHLLVFAFLSYNFR